MKILFDFEIYVQAAETNLFLHSVSDSPIAAVSDYVKYNW